MAAGCQSQNNQRVGHQNVLIFGCMYLTAKSSKSSVNKFLHKFFFAADKRFLTGTLCSPSPYLSIKEFYVKRNMRICLHTDLDKF